MKGTNLINPKKGGGGWNPPYAQEIGCHFSRNDPNVLKLPDFFKNDVGLKVKFHFGHILNDCPENGPS